MKPKRNYPIGTLFECQNGKMYEVLESNGLCRVNGRECAFSTKPKACNSSACTPNSRIDGKRVCFIRRKDLEQPKETSQEVL